MKNQNLQALLAMKNSRISQVLKLSLYGLEATLNQAKLEYPDDPGNELCQQVISEITELLKSQTLTENTQNQNNQKQVSQESQSSNLLDELRTSFENDLELKFYLGYAPLQSQNDSELWSEIHRKLLRVPEDVATIWRNRALEIAQKVGVSQDYVNMEHLPFARDEILYPGLSGAVEARGLCLSKKLLLKSEIAENYQSEELQLLAGFLLLYEKIIDIDPELHHALKSVFSFDIVSLKSQPEQHQLYLQTLGDRLQRTQKAEENTDPIINLRAWIDIDEAIHSLVFLPPAERYSWWGKLQQESRKSLKKVAHKAIQAGYDIKIKQLSGLYADICAYTKDDLQLDYGGTPGEVLACLRLYVKINQEENPGRVIFRSLR
ncbi:MAG: hypothetical protein EAZ76_11985 [Nostocales cyanobacterium]|nr:MAG: hypothetical protein EAZ87_07105 [Nostocales cyanobacterium]TAF13334.1 MAG: hypothetical protein EAZ76_11985 [Nostocales cyanobacterium]